MMRELAGITLGSYRLIEQTAVGGMAVIFKAYDEALDRYVAIKILPDYLSHDTDFSARFRNEARNVARLRHPNILPIFGYGEQDGLSYFVMDLVEGGTLKDVMGAPLPPERVETLITQIAGALDYAHQQGVVHRDVKPSNVLMLRPDWALLSDFGIARVLEQTANLTHTGSAFFGTPHYMAPEQARGEQVSARTDQYALGIVLYEMLTGTTPYRADTPQAVVYQHIYSPPPPPREKNPAITPAMEAVILRSLSKDPVARYPAMADFAAAVHRAMQPASTPLLGGTEPDPETAAPDPFPPAAATPAFRPAQTDTRGKTGPVTERIEVMPDHEPAGDEAAPSRPPASGRRVPFWLLFTAGGAAVLVIAIIALFALRGAGSPEPLVPVALMLPPSVSLTHYAIETEDGGRRVASGAVNGSAVHVRLSPGTYRFDPVDGDGFLFPVRFVVSASGAHTIDLRRLYGHLSIVPPAGHVSVPGLNLQHGHENGGASSTAATQGVYAAPGQYLLSFYPSDYPLTPHVTLRAGRTTALDLRRSYGRLTLTTVPGAPPSGLNVLRATGGADLTSINVGQERGGFYLPAGNYRLVYFNSDIYIDPVPVTVAAGQGTTLDLATVLARCVVPSAPSNTLTYSWRKDGTLHTITATPHRRLVYILAGRYRMEITRNGSTHVVTVAATAGRTTNLPPR